MRRLQDGILLLVLDVVLELNQLEVKLAYFFGDLDDAVFVVDAGLGGSCVRGHGHSVCAHSRLAHLVVLHQLGLVIGVLDGERGARGMVQGRALKPDGLAVLNGGRHRALIFRREAA